MPEPIKEIFPEGVKLRDFDDHETARHQLYDGVAEEMLRSFPASYGGVKMDIGDVHYADPDDYDTTQQKDAVLQDKFLARRLRGKITLTDEKTGELLDQYPAITLLHTPHITERGTIIHNGSEYSSAIQARLRPGPFTRNQNNGDSETMFNIKPGTGVPFRVGLEKETGMMRIRVKQANLHYYSLVHDLGVSDEDLERRWGPQLLDQNRKKYDSRVLDKAYQRLVPRRLQTPDPTREAKVESIKKALEQAQMSTKIAQKNLPNLFDQTKAASWRSDLEKQGRVYKMINSMPFRPDMSPIEIAEDYGVLSSTFLKSACFFRFVKIAKTQPFRPDIIPDDLKDEVNSLYGKVGPRLAGMESWPEEWFPEGSDPMGWLQWYEQYHHGRRMEDDERQISRWRNFKARHGTAFRKNPTPRRAFALRNWAINPLLLLPMKDRADFKKKMQEYKDTETEKYETEKSAYIVKMSASKGCLMLNFSRSDSRKILEWAHENIPEDQTADDGYEDTPHVTVLYGFASDVDKKELDDMIPKEKFVVKLGKIDRFPASEFRPDSDVLIVKIDCPALHDLNKRLREKFGDRVKNNYTDYKPHMTLSYVKPGALPDLTGHSKFEGAIFLADEVVFSLPDSKSKYFWNKGKSKEEESTEEEKE